jgi:hypothetical protein
LTSFDAQIDTALGPRIEAPVQVTVINDAELPSCFDVTDLAVASLRSAAVELAALRNAGMVEIDRRLTALWFDMTLRPKDWRLPSAWDAIAGSIGVQTDGSAYTRMRHTIAMRFCGS